MGPVNYKVVNNKQFLPFIQIKSNFILYINQFTSSAGRKRAIERNKICWEVNELTHRKGFLLPE